jgi:hypothetical protein
MERCIHCLGFTETPEKDHVFPDSWYPTSTPPTIQRWTAPSCPDCNRSFGQLEHDLLIRLVPSLDTSSDAARGLDERVYRSLGIDVEDSNKDKVIRERVRAKLRAEFFPYEEIRGLPGQIPGLGPPPDQPPGPAVFIPWAGLSMMAEKIARGCEYRHRNSKRYVEHPYGVLPLISNTDELSNDPMLRFTKLLDFGPGCQVRRGFASEDPAVVRYFITIWDRLHFKVLIDFRDYLDDLKKQLPNPGGVLPPMNRAMQVPDYLRSFNQ